MGSAYLVTLLPSPRPWPSGHRCTQVGAGCLQPRTLFVFPRRPVSSGVYVLSVTWKPHTAAFCFLYLQPIGSFRPWTEQVDVWVSSPSFSVSVISYFHGPRNACQEYITGLPVGSVAKTLCSQCGGWGGGLGLIPGQGIRHHMP